MWWRLLASCSGRKMSGQRSRGAVTVALVAPALAGALAFLGPLSLAQCFVPCKKARWRKGCHGSGSWAVQWHLLRPPSHKFFSLESYGSQAGERASENGSGDNLRAGMVRQGTARTRRSQAPKKQQFSRHASSRPSAMLAAFANSQDHDRVQNGLEGLNPAPHLSFTNASGSGVRHAESSSSVNLLFPVRST